MTLEATKAMMEVIVIDQVAKPTENWAVYRKTVKAHSGFSRVRRATSSYSWLYRILLGIVSNVAR